MFKSLNDVFSYNNLNNCRIDFSTMQVYLLLFAYGNNKSGKFKECYSNLSDIKEFFEVKFCFKSLDDLKYLTLNCEDSVSIKNQILELKKEHEFFITKDFHASNDNEFKAEIVNIDEALGQCVEIKKKEARLKNFKDILITEQRVIKLKIKSDYDNLKIHFNSSEIRKLAEKFDSLGQDVLSFLKSDKAEIEKYEITIYRNDNLKLAGIQFFESIGVKFEHNEIYNRIVKLEIFDKLGG